VTGGVAVRPVAPRAIQIDRGPATWLLYILLGLFAYIETAVGPSMPFLRDELDLGYTVASLHFAAIAAGAVAIGLVADRIARRVGRRTALWGGMLGMAVGGAMIAVGPHVIVTVAGAFAMGAIGAVALVTNQASLADLHGDGRVVALAESNVVASAGAILAPLVIGAASRTQLGWRTGLLITLPTLAVLALAGARVPMPPAHAPRRSGADEHRLPRLFWLFALLLFVAGSVEWCVAYWGADFLETEVGMRRFTAAAAMSLFFAAMVAGRLAGARLARRRLPLRLLLGSLAVAAFGLPILWQAGNAPVALLGLFVAGAGIANFYPLTVGVATSVAPALIDASTARLAAASGTSLLIMPFSMGRLADVIGMQRAFAMTIVLVLVALAIALVAARVAGRASVAERSA
jgi:fucose permease